MVPGKKRKRAAGRLLDSVSLFHSQSLLCSLSLLLADLCSLFCSLISARSSRASVVVGPKRPIDNRVASGPRVQGEGEGLSRVPAQGAVALHCVRGNTGSVLLPAKDVCRTTVWLGARGGPTRTRTSTLPRVELHLLSPRCVWRSGQVRKSRALGQCVSWVLLFCFSASRLLQHAHKTCSQRLWPAFSSADGFHLRRPMGGDLLL